MKINTNKDRVMKYIRQNFDLTAWDLEDCPYLPGGTLLKCKSGGSILIWADIIGDSVYCSFNGEPAVKVPVF